jgi:hypothetical protein
MPFLKELKKKNKMKHDNLFKTLLVSTFAFVLLYWALVFTGIFPVKELVEGYVTWFMSFPVADFFLGISALLSFLNFKKNPKKSGFWGAIAGSALIFLGLYAVLYGINTGLIFILTTDEIIEICIKIYCLSAGTFILFHSWKLIKG